jgi:hypothetical protein
MFFFIFFEDELWPFAGSELHTIIRSQDMSCYQLAIYERSVPAILVLNDKLLTFLHKNCVSSRNKGLRKQQLALRRTPDRERKTVDQDCIASLAVD